jgi:hypothetical protein
VPVTNLGFHTTDWNGIQKLAKRTAADDELEVIVEKMWEEIVRGCPAEKSERESATAPSSMAANVKKKKAHAKDRFFQIACGY